MPEALCVPYLKCVSSDRDYPYSNKYKFNTPYDAPRRSIAKDEIQKALSTCQIEDFKVIESLALIQIYFKEENDCGFFKFAFETASTQLLEFGYRFRLGRTAQDLQQLEQEMNALAQSLEQQGVFKTSLDIEERTLIIHMTKNNFFPYQALIKQEGSENNIPTYNRTPALVSSQILSR